MAGPAPGSPPPPCVPPHGRPNRAAGGVAGAAGAARSGGRRRLRAGARTVPSAPGRPVLRSSGGVGYLAAAVVYSGIGSTTMCPLQG